MQVESNFEKHLINELLFVWDDKHIWLVREELRAKRTPIIHKGHHEVMFSVELVTEPNNPQLDVFRFAHEAVTRINGHISKKMVDQGIVEFEGFLTPT